MARYRIGCTLSNGQVVTLDHVESTQDEALKLDLQIGDVCRSFNQTTGRGRRGNEWNASGGVAVTVVVETATQHLPIAIAVTLATSLNNLIPQYQVGIKWPNDVYVDGKKLAGVLIEQREGRCFVGVGVNVLEAPIATSTALYQLGFNGTRESVADVVATSVFDATQLDGNKAVTSWRDRDILVGTILTVQSGDNIVEGLVLSIDPCHNLLLQTDSGILELPAETSTIVTSCK
jgi:BirA family biotin operon repressor/biotin-[acetyl-CoA-carboxylase] ligase